MKTITKLAGTITESDFREGAGHHHHVGQSHETKTTDGRRGAVFIRSMRIGPEGIIFKAGTAEVAIRSVDLWKLAELAEPGLAIPKEVEVPKAAGKDSTIPATKT
jgi:hypothetical protein